MRKFIRNLVVVATAVALMTLPVLLDAQVNTYQLSRQPATVSSVRTAGDNAPAIYIKYVGDDVVPSAGVTTVATVADTSITFVLNGAAYDGFECPVSGALGGVIDTGHADCDTLGETVDAINSDIKKNFVAFIWAGLRSDVIETTTNLLSDAADNDVLSPEGEIIYWDSSVSDDEEVAFWEISKGVQVFLQPGQNRVNDKSPFRNSNNVVLFGWEQLTNAGTLSTVNLYCVVENYADGSEVVNVLHSEPAGATTAYNAINDVTAVGGWQCRGGKVFMRVVASGADTSAWNLGLYGYRSPLE